MKTNEKIALCLRNLRKEKGYTQESLIKTLNDKGHPIALPTYRSYEQGRETPKLETLIYLSELYDVSIDFLIGRSTCRSVDNEYINQKTGLNDMAIDTLKYIKDHCVIFDRLGVSPDDVPDDFLDDISHEIDTLNMLLANKLLASHFLKGVDEYIYSYRNTIPSVITKDGIIEGQERALYLGNKYNSYKVPVLMDSEIVKNVAIEHIKHVFNSIQTVCMENE